VAANSSNGGPDWALHSTFFGGVFSGVMKRALTFGVLGITLCLSANAGAQSTIKSPGRHPDYSFEAEPHVYYGFDPPGAAAGKGWGPGFRGTVELVDNGFIKSINNTVGLGFGIDWIAFHDSKTSLWVPIVMQWNFWLNPTISVFGEPGGGLYLGNASGVRPAMYGGARFHFSEKLALTLRVGYPGLSAGVSFVF
jgi:hypothetical protein